MHPNEAAFTLLCAIPISFAINTAISHVINAQRDHCRAHDVHREIELETSLRVLVRK